MQMCVNYVRENDIVHIIDNYEYFCDSLLIAVSIRIRMKAC